MPHVIGERTPSRSVDQDDMAELRILIGHSAIYTQFFRGLVTGIIELSPVSVKSGLEQGLSPETSGTIPLSSRNRVRKMSTSLAISAAG
jgi:hypothetical protein